MQSLGQNLFETGLEVSRQLGLVLTFCLLFMIFAWASTVYNVSQIASCEVPNIPYITFMVKPFHHLNLQDEVRCEIRLTKNMSKFYDKLPTNYNPLLISANFLSDETIIGKRGACHNLIRPVDSLQNLLDIGKHLEEGNKGLHVHWRGSSNSPSTLDLAFIL